MTTPALDAGAGSVRVVYRYVPPDQPAACAVTYIGDTLLRFALTFTGSLTLACPAERDGGPSDVVQRAGAALHRIADGLYLSAARVDHPRIESRAGHRFRHRDAGLAGPRTRRFTGDCSVLLPGAPVDDAGAGRLGGGLGYVLDVTAHAPSDPPAADGAWLPRYDDSLATIGAIVLEPVPITPARAARLHAG